MHAKDYYILAVTHHISFLLMCYSLKQLTMPEKMLKLGEDGILGSVRLNIAVLQPKKNASPPQS